MAGGCKEDLDLDPDDADLSEQGVDLCGTGGGEGVRRRWEEGRVKRRPRVGEWNESETVRMDTGGGAGWVG